MFRATRHSAGKLTGSRPLPAADRAEREHLPGAAAASCTAAPATRSASSRRLTAPRPAPAAIRGRPATRRRRCRDRLVRRARRRMDPGGLPLRLQAGSRPAGRVRKPSKIKRVEANGESYLVTGVPAPSAGHKCRGGFREPAGAGDRRGARGAASCPFHRPLGGEVPKQRVRVRAKLGGLAQCRAARRSVKCCFVSSRRGDRSCPDNLFP